MKCRNTGQEIKTDRQKKESGTEKEDREGRMNRDWCQWEVMYRGEGDESELASLSAPVMSLSKRSIIFNGAQLQGKREKRRAQNLCMKTHTLPWHMQTTQKITDLYTLTQSALSSHAQIYHTHALWYSDTHKVLWELMELRHRGLETGSCTQLGVGEGVGELKRKEEELGSIGIHMRICAEVRGKME